MRVRCPHIHLRIEPTRIIEARRSDRDKLRVRVGLDHNRRAAFRAKPRRVMPPASLGEGWKRSDPCKSLNACAGMMT
jgi:hypothetical protein